MLEADGVRLTPTLPDSTGTCLLLAPLLVGAVAGVTDVRGTPAPPEATGTLLPPGVLLTLPRRDALLELLVAAGALDALGRPADDDDDDVPLELR